MTMKPITSDLQTLQAQAQKDGLNLQSVRQQAIAALPANSTPQQQQAAAIAAVQQAVQSANDPTLNQDLSKVQQDQAQMHKKHHHGQNQAVQNIINKGSSATVAEISSALGSVSSKSPDYATLQSMLVAAQAKIQQQQQQPGGSVGTNLNFLS